MQQQSSAGYETTYVLTGKKNSRSYRWGLGEGGGAGGTTFISHPKTPPIFSMCEDEANFYYQTDNRYGWNLRSTV